MHIHINQQSIDILRQIGDRVSGLPDNIASETQDLLNDTREHEAVLGPYLSLLTDALQTIMQAAGEAGQPAKEIGELLHEIADDYDLIVNYDPFSKLSREDG